MENSSEQRNEAQGLVTISDDTVINHEVSEEFSLPDYVPEVRRVLFTRAQVLPESKYVSDSTTPPTIELGGTVTYSIIYTNEEGKLCALPLNSAYEVKSPISSMGDSFIDTTVESCTTRVTAPRKLTVKSKLKSRILGFQEKVEEENITPRSSADEMYIERKKEAVMTLGIIPVSLQNIRMSEKLDMAGLEGAKPIWCDATIILNDVKAQNCSVSVRGEATVKCLCVSSEGESIITKTMPLVEEVEAEGASIGDMAMLKARCVSLSISNEENGDKNELFFDLNCELEGEVTRNSEVLLTKDAYSTKNETQATYKKIDIYKRLKSQNASFTVSEALKRKNEEINEIIEIIVDPVYEKTEIKGTRAQLLGTLLVNIIGKSKANEEGVCEYLHDSYELPIKYESDLGKINGDVITRCNFSQGNINARYDNERFYVTAEIFPAFSIYERSSCEVLDRATLKKDIEFKRDPACVRVCFPHENETLWDISKKYHTTVSKLAEVNGISPDSPLNIKSLII
ncbi:MAG: LysM peptidoglycan-binding domain-containing protein [Clostridia bacterium]|nr:LysM peptidoglycan-binding domain-containing protein [Clostridia bacterium]